MWKCCIACWFKWNSCRVFSQHVFWQVSRERVARAHNTNKDYIPAIYVNAVQLFVMLRFVWVNVSKRLLRKGLLSFIFTLHRLCSYCNGFYSVYAWKCWKQACFADTFQLRKRQGWKMRRSSEQQNWHVLTCNWKYISRWSVIWRFSTCGTTLLFFWRKISGSWAAECVTLFIS